MRIDGADDGVAGRMPKTCERPRRRSSPPARRRHRRRHSPLFPLTFNFLALLLSSLSVEAYLTSPHLDALDGLLPQEAAALQALQAAAAAAAPPVLTGVQLFEQLEALQLLHTVGGVGAAQTPPLIKPFVASEGNSFPPQHGPHHRCRCTTPASCTLHSTARAAHLCRAA